MTEISNRVDEISEDSNIIKSEFTEIEKKFKGLKPIQKENLKEKYDSLKERFKVDEDKIIEITSEDSSLLKSLFLPKNKEHLAELLKLTEYFNITDQSKVEKIGSQLLLAGLKPANFLNTYKNNIETKLSGIKNVENGEAYLEKIKLSIGKTFLNIGEEINLLENDVKSLKNGKNIYDYKWDIQEKINENFNFINTELIPSTEILIKEGGKINGTTSYLKYIFSNGNKKGNQHINFYKNIEGIIETLESDVLENGTFSEGLDSFDTDGIVSGSTDKAILGNKGIKELSEVDILSSAEKKLQAEAESAKIGIILAMLVPVAGDIASLPSDWKDLIDNNDGLTEYGKNLGLIPKEYNKLNSTLDRVLGGVGVLASIAVIIGAGVAINKIIKGGKLAKLISKLKKLGVKNPEKMIESSFNNAKKAIGKGEEKEVIKTKKLLEKVDENKIIEIKKGLNNISDKKILENPYRYEKEIIKYINEIEKIIEKNDLGEKLPPEILQTLRQSYKKNDLIENKIKEINKTIRDSDLDTNWGEDIYLTKDDYFKMNKDTVKYPEGMWNEELIQNMNLDEYINFINTNSSGRYILHSFPEISIKKGVISNQMGAGKEYQAVKGGSGTGINFTTDGYIEDDKIRGFYPSFQSTGGVFYPIETILENYGFANISKKSSEWVMHGPAKNPNSSLHKVPLNLGINFFDIKDKTKIDNLINNLQKNKKPNKIIWYGKGQEYNEEADALTGFIKKLKNTNKKDKDLPHISKTIKPLWNIKNKVFAFGSSTAKEKIKLNIKKENNIQLSNPELVKRNAKLKPQERLDKSSQLLEKNFSPEQEKAILDAHNVGKDNRQSGIYNYSYNEIKEKYLILKENGFKKEEIKILMDNGIVGKYNPNSHLENMTLEKVFSQNKMNFHLSIRKKFINTDQEKILIDTYIKYVKKEITNPNQILKDAGIDERFIKEMNLFPDKLTKNVKEIRLPTDGKKTGLLRKKIKKDVPNYEQDNVPEFSLKKSLKKEEPLIKTEINTQVPNKTEILENTTNIIEKIEKINDPKLSFISKKLKSIGEKFKKGFSKKEVLQIEEDTSTIIKSISDISDPIIKNDVIKNINSVKEYLEILKQHKYIDYKGILSKKINNGIIIDFNILSNGKIKTRISIDGSNHKEGTYKLGFNKTFKDIEEFKKYVTKKPKKI